MHKAFCIPAYAGMTDLKLSPRDAAKFRDVQVLVIRGEPRTNRDADDISTATLRDATATQPPTPHRHSREGGNPAMRKGFWIPAYAGMTSFEFSTRDADEFRDVQVLVIRGEPRTNRDAADISTTTLHDATTTQPQTPHRHSRKGGNPAMLKRSRIAAYEGLMRA